MSLAILPLLEMDLHIRNGLIPPLITIINNINGDFNILDGIERLIPTHGIGTLNCDIWRKLAA